MSQFWISSPHLQMNTLHRYDPVPKHNLPIKIRHVQHLSPLQRQLATSVVTGCLRWQAQLTHPQMGFSLP